MFLLIIKAGILLLGMGELGIRTQFIPKKPSITDLRIIYNFKPGINKYIIKLAYPIYNLDIVVTIVVKAKFSVFFSTDAVNRY